MPISLTKIGQIGRYTDHIRCNSLKSSQSGCGSCRLRPQAYTDTSRAKRQEAKRSTPISLAKIGQIGCRFRFLLPKTYVDTAREKNRKMRRFQRFLVVAAAPEQDDHQDQQPAAIVLKQIVKTTAHMSFPPYRLFALSYEGGAKGVTERKSHGRKNLFH